MDYDLTDVGGPHGEHPVVRHHRSGSDNGQWNDGRTGLVRHLERTILELTEATRLGSSTLGISAQHNSVRSRRRGGGGAERNAQ